MLMVLVQREWITRKVHWIRSVKLTYLEFHYLFLQCVVVVIEHLTKSAVDVSCQNLKPIDQRIVRVHCEAERTIISYIICD